MLNQTLAKPPECRVVREYNPNIKGRLAYSLPVYKENTRVKILELEARMEAIGDRSNPEWLKLRK